MGEHTALFGRAAARYGEPQFSTDGLLLRRERKQRNQRVAAGVLGIAVFAIAAVGLVRLFASGGTPATDPEIPFTGTWVSTSDADGGTQTMEVEVLANDTVEIVVTDDVATVCSGTPSTMTGAGRLEGPMTLVIPAPDYRCDDGSEPQALSGPPLEEQLRDLTFVLDPETQTLTDGSGGVWVRESAAIPSPEPTTSGVMWPQSGQDEINAAQERADAGDPAYTWQVEPALVESAEPFGAEIIERFLQAELGWEAFAPLNGYAYLEEGGLYDELRFVRCAPGRTNPLSSAYAEIPPEIRGCAPTIDDFRFETVYITLEQPARTDPSGIWVVSAWRLLEPDPASDDPDFYARQAEQEAPPSDAEVDALMQAFLGARVDGEGAERYVRPSDEPTPDSEVPLLYASSEGARYERFEFERVAGPEWPTGRSEYQVRLFAEDRSVIAQSFVVVRDENGLLRLDYGPQITFRGFPTTENGQPVAVPYSLLDGEITFAAAPPWRTTSIDRSSATLGGVGRGSASQLTMFTVTVDPRTGVGCGTGPSASDVDALVRSIRSNPELETTAPVTVSVGGIDAVQMDVVGPDPTAGDCYRMVIDGIRVGTVPTRLYLLDLLEGMSARTLAIGITAADSELEFVVRAAGPVLDSFEFHTP